MSNDQSPNTSDEEDFENQQPEICGTLSKWTNYIHGWQARYIVLRKGTLTYYKSEHVLSFGCRGAVSIHKATIKPHEFDECRFDVSVNDCVWYLRCDSSEEKQRWVDALESYKAESGYGSENNLRRHGSAVSLVSNTLSTASSSSFKTSHGLRERLSEMETYRDILCQQVESLQTYFDACVEAAVSIHHINGHSRTSLVDSEDEEDTLTNNIDQNNIDNKSKRTLHPLVSKELLLQHGIHALDFKGEAITFKATTSGILSTLSHCMELMGQREDSWKRRFDREVEKRRKIEDLYKQAVQESHDKKLQVVVVGGPDYEEGPHSALKEEEFFDAVEMGLDKMEEEENYLERLKSVQSGRLLPCATSHQLWPEIDLVTIEQFRYACLGVGEGCWQLFAEDGEMRLYKREEELDGMVVDPLKAVHTVKGVTGREMCETFFYPDTRFDWDITVETVTTLESVSEDTTVFHQIHKRVWPASQRDSLFWSHIRTVPNSKDEDSHDIWIVCNQSTNHPDWPVNQGKYVRVFLTCCLVCHTFIDPPKDGTEITRDHLTCKITYCSVVNPGGWAPASVLRAVYKREYPRFLKRFTSYVIEKCKDKPIMF